MGKMARKLFVLLGCIPFVSVLSIHQKTDDDGGLQLPDMYMCLPCVSMIGVRRYRAGPVQPVVDL